MGRGADPALCTLHHHMNCLHLATYFNLPTIIRLMAHHVHVDSLCESFGWGSGLHYAVRNLNVGACQALLEVCLGGGGFVSVFVEKNCLFYFLTKKINLFCILIFLFSTIIKFLVQRGF